MTITESNGTLRIGTDFVDAELGAPKTRGTLELLPSGKKYDVISTFGCSDTSDALIRCMRKEGKRGNIMTQAI